VPIYTPSRVSEEGSAITCPRAIRPALLVTALVAAAAVAAAAFAVVSSPSPRAAADLSPTGAEYRPISFPVEGPVSYWDDFGACRSGCTRRHEGQDLMGAKMQKLLAAVDGRITFMRTDSSGNSGNMLTIKDAAGWSYVYIHVNNDTPGTDDGANRFEHAFAPGMAVGVRVKAGQHIAYMGDSGNAEGTAPHLHFEMRTPDGSPFSPWTSLRLAQGHAAGGLCRFPSNPKPAPDANANRGYWAVDSGGSVYAFGAARHLGAPPAAPGRPPIVALAPTPAGGGYWVADAAGEVHAFGDAAHHGSMAGVPLNAPVIGMTATGTGRGYWLLAQDGGIFSFGDARFHGSMGDMKLNAPVIAMASTPSGRGYWLLGADGGIFSFGDAVFHGSTGNMRLNAPVVGIATTATGGGYWLLGRDGGVFGFGDATFRGSLPGTGRCSIPAAVAMTRSTTGKGYWVLLADGRIEAFGDAAVHGEPATHGARPVGLTAVPRS
jgi:murein DD-endopeptidase MepM/ murein hydrolase activator NlpD